MLASVGSPWEIGRSSTLTADGRVVDLYSKSGGIGLYVSEMVLIPDYDVGLTVLVAGDSGAMVPLLDQTLATLIPAVEAIGRDDARKRYAGIYRSASPAPANSSITIVVDSQAPGLKVEQWISNGKDMLAEYAALRGANRTRPVDARLYPTALTRGSRGGGNSSAPATQSKSTISRTRSYNATLDEGREEEAFRAVYHILPDPARNATSNSPPGVFSMINACSTWDAIDGLVYGTRAFDGFVFRSDGKGNVISLENRALRAVLSKSTEA